MKKVLEFVGAKSDSYIFNLLMLFLLLSIVDLHAQLMKENIFSISSLDYLTKHLFGIAATFVMVAIVVISMAGVFYFFVLVASGVIVHVVLQILSRISDKLVYRSEYSIEALARMGRYIGYDGNLGLLKYEHDSDAELGSETWWLLAFFGALALEITKATQFGTEFHSVFRSFFDAISMQPNPSDSLTSGFSIVAVVVQGAILLAVIYLLWVFWSQVVRSVVISNELVPLLFSRDKNKEIQEIERLQAAFSRYGRKLPSDF